MSESLSSLQAECERLRYSLNELADEVEYQLHDEFPTPSRLRAELNRARSALSNTSVHLTEASGQAATGRGNHELQCICGACWEITADGDEMLVSAPAIASTGEKQG